MMSSGSKEGASELSILIPARNEMFLKNTVRDITDNMRADTEIIVVLDGQWPLEPLRHRGNLNVVYFPEHRAEGSDECRM
jgi:hypothetical protein